MVVLVSTSCEPFSQQRPGVGAVVVRGFVHEGLARHYLSLRADFWVVGSGENDT
jgi:hypothetical protein